MANRLLDDSAAAPEAARREPDAQAALRRLEVQALLALDDPVLDPLDALSFGDRPKRPRGGRTPPHRRSW